MRSISKKIGKVALTLQIKLNHYNFTVNTCLTGDVLSMPENHDIARAIARQNFNTNGPAERNNPDLALGRMRRNQIAAALQ